jgi:hypothetical protein
MEGMPFGLEHPEQEQKDGKDFSSMFAEMPPVDHELESETVA